MTFSTIQPIGKRPYAMPYAAVLTIEPIEAFQHQIVEMLEEGGLQFVTGLAVGAGRRYRRHASQGLEDPSERLL